MITLSGFISRTVWPLALATVLLQGLSAKADSMRAGCGFSDSPSERPSETEPCVFSQRQGYIGIYFDDGREYNFSPAGDSPGNYSDDKGLRVYRKSGLGQEGQLFQLPERYLYVFWLRAKYECSAQELETPGQCVLSMREPISFSLLASSGSSLNQLSVTPDGLEITNDAMTAELDGTAYRAEIADLDSNGWPEVYVYVSSAGSGSYGSLLAWAVNNGKSVTPIYLPPMEDAAASGYMGHDEFTLVENRLARRFPIYVGGDTNAAPTGGTRQLSYRLEAGEAGWILVVDSVSEFWKGPPD